MPLGFYIWLAMVVPPLVIMGILFLLGVFDKIGRENHEAIQQLKQRESSTKEEIKNIVMGGKSIQLKQREFNRVGYCNSIRQATDGMHTLEYYYSLEKNITYP